MSSKKLVGKLRTNAANNRHRHTSNLCLRVLPDLHACYVHIYGCGKYVVFMVKLIHMHITDTFLSDSETSASLQDIIRMMACNNNEGGS